MIRVLIVDDHPVFRSGLRGLLSALDMKVAGEAKDGGWPSPPGRRSPS